MSFFIDSFIYNGEVRAIKPSIPLNQEFGCRPPPPTNNSATEAEAIATSYRDDFKITKLMYYTI